MKIFCQFPTVNISKLNFRLVICIAKKVKGDFSQYLDFFAPSDSRFSNSCILAKYCPNHTSMERLFIQLSDDEWMSISVKAFSEEQNEINSIK